jgi:hypothetical protein
LKPRLREQNGERDFTLDDKPTIRAASKVAFAHSQKRGDPWIAPVCDFNDIRG